MPEIPQIDASIITRAKPPEFDPLSTVQKATALGRGVLENRLLGQQIGGKEALGRAVTGATDKETGETDFDKAATALALDPQGAFALPEFSAQVLDREAKKIANQVAQQGLDQKQLETSQKTYGAVGDWATAIAAAGAQDAAALKSTSIFQSAKAALVDTGLINPQNKAQADQLLGVMAQFGDDPKQNLELLKKIVLQARATTDGINLVMGPVSTVDTGAEIQTRRVSPLTNEVTQVGDPIAKELPPTTLAELVEVTGPGGVKYKVPRGALGGLPGDAGASGAPGGARTGRYPGAGGAGSSLPADAPAGAVAATSLAPGVSEALTASATKSADAWQKALAQAGGYAERIQGLDKAYENLEKASTGKGTQKLQTYGTVLNSFFPGKAPTNVDAYAQAEKYLTDYAVRRGSDLGMGTDSARAMVAAANPGVQTPKGAAKAVVTVMKGLERMDATQVAIAQKEGITPDKFADWKAKWSRSVDPTAFIPPKLTKEGWEAKKKAMGDKWPAYSRGLNAALAAGILKPSDVRK